MSTIPASEVVAVNPSVLPAGGSALNLNGMFLTTDTRPPIGSVLSFASEVAVGNFFGATSLLATLAAKYFAGFDISTKKPGAMLVAQYPLANVGAYLRGGNLTGMTLAQLQAFNAALTVTVDGVLKTATVNLAGSTSFTNAAELIADALGMVGAVAATVTGSISGTTFTAASGLTGTLGPGQVISGTGVTVSTYILAQLTGPAGGLGTYQVSDSQTAGSTVVTAHVPAVSYDSVSGAFVFLSPTTGASSTITFGTGALATDLLLTQALGATLSQGAVAAIPAAFMNATVQQTRNFASFALTFNPDVSGNDISYAFAQWTATQNNRFMYVAWDADATPSTTVPAPTSLAGRVANAGISGVCPNWQPAGLVDGDGANLAAFVCGAVASIDFSRPNGRATLKFRRQSGLEPGVTDQTVFDNLAANGYNSYGAYATANDEFRWYANGVVSGPFLWIDSYVNQIWLNNSFQLALISFLLASPSVPYNAAGRAAIEAALSDVIQQGLLFGVYRPGVTLSGTQISAVNAAAGGREIATTLSNQGWYLLVGAATPEVRQARGSPPCTFFYADGQSVQTIDLASIALL